MIRVRLWQAYATRPAAGRRSPARRCNAALTVRPATESATVTDTRDPTLPSDDEAGRAPDRSAARDRARGRRARRRVARGDVRIVGWSAPGRGAGAAVPAGACRWRRSLPSSLVRREGEPPAGRRAAGAVRPHPGLGATGRRAGQGRRPRRRRRAVPARRRHLLRHRDAPGAVAAVVVGRPRRAGDRVPHRGRRVRVPDPVAAARARPGVDAHVRAGRPVRGAEADRLRRVDRARRRADRGHRVPACPTRTAPSA